jgi:hypothetical protein
MKGECLWPGRRSSTRALTYSWVWLDGLGVCIVWHENGRPSKEDAFSTIRHNISTLEECADIMKMISGALLLIASEQAYAHTQLVQFPNHDAASRTLIPASVVFLALGTLLMVWGLFTESRMGKTGGA